VGFGGTPREALPFVTSTRVIGAKLHSPNTLRRYDWMTPMNSKQVGRSWNPAAAANAIMHVDVRVFSLLPPAVRFKARRTACTDRLYFHVLPENHVLLADHKVCTLHSFRIVKRRLTLHNGCCFNIETHVSLCDKRDHLNYCEEVTFSFDLLWIISELAESKRKNLNFLYARRAQFRFNLGIIIWLFLY